MLVTKYMNGDVKLTELMGGNLASWFEARGNTVPEVPQIDLSWSWREGRHCCST